MAKGQFSISPHVVRQLGAELVTDHVTALMELIKNSYDADATYVKVTIDTQGKYEEASLYYPDHKGYILVEDNGCGMDEATITKSWLTISYSSKRAVGGKKKTSKKGRTPLGDKGLGRLSTQRLANICEIISKKENGKGVHAGFDWRSFDTALKFSDVDVPIEAINWDKPHGTKLILEDLISSSNTWTEDGMVRFKAMLCQLVSPYKELRPFSVYVSINGEKIDLDQEMSKLTKSAVSDITFVYKNQEMKIVADICPRKLLGNDSDTYKRIIENDKGKAFCDYFLSQKNSKNFSKLDDGKEHFLRLNTGFGVSRIFTPTIFNSVFPDPCDFSAKIREFSFSRDEVSTMSWNQLYDNFNAYKTFVQKQIGIKLFRDGFAIRPYGIDGQDWLDLSSGQTSGASFYGLRPGNVIGYVSISEGININLKDKTDREGLVDNEYYFSFRNLLITAIEVLNQEFNILRRAYNDFKKIYAQKNQKIKTLEQAFSEIAKQSDYAEQASSEYGTVQIQFSRIKEKINDIVELDATSIDDVQYRTVVSSSFRDISKSVDDTQQVLNQVQGVLEKSKLMDEVLAILRPKLDRLEEQLAEFSELASLGLISEMVSHDLGQVASRLMVKGIELDKALKSGKELDRVLLYSVVEYIKSTCTSIKTQIKHLDSSLKYSRDKKESLSLTKFLREEELAYYSHEFEEHNIVPQIEVVNDFNITVNSGKLIQVFDNLINNSVYWLKHFKVENPCINIKIDSPWVYFADNGLGIDQSIEESLFDPFMTCKPVGKGRGLGLFIVRQMLDDFGCNISLSDARNSWGRKYCFVLNLSGLI